MLIFWLSSWLFHPNVPKTLSFVSAIVKNQYKSLTVATLATKIIENIKPEFRTTFKGYFLQKIR